MFLFNVQEEVTLRRSCNIIGASIKASLMLRWVTNTSQGPYNVYQYVSVLDRLTVMSSLKITTGGIDCAQRLKTEPIGPAVLCFYIPTLTLQFDRPAQILSSTAASSGTRGRGTSGVATAGLAAISTGLHWHGDPIKDGVLKRPASHRNVLMKRRACNCDRSLTLATLGWC